MSSRVLTEGEVARLGREIYAQDIRPKVEREHDGEFLVIDVSTGDYEAGADDAAAFDRAEAKNPEGLFFLMRVGRVAAHRIGGSTRVV